MQYKKQSALKQCRKHLNQRDKQEIIYMWAHQINDLYNAQQIVKKSKASSHYTIKWNRETVNL